MCAKFGTAKKTPWGTQYIIIDRLVALDIKYYLQHRDNSKRLYIVTNFVCTVYDLPSISDISAPLLFFGGVGEGRGKKVYYSREITLPITVRLKVWYECTQT